MHILEAAMRQDFQKYLIEDEKSRETISKYLRDTGAFFRAVQQSHSSARQDRFFCQGSSAASCFGLIFVSKVF